MGNQLASAAHAPSNSPLCAGAQTRAAQCRHFAVGDDPGSTEEASDVAEASTASSLPPAGDPFWDDPLRIGDSGDYQYATIQAEGSGDHSKRLSRTDKRERKRALRGVDRQLIHRSVAIPSTVEASAVGTRLFFSGPLGSNAIDLQKVDSRGLAAFRVLRGPQEKISEVQITGPCADTVRSAKTLVQNRVDGVVRGYLMYMQLVGVGYRVSKQNRDVTFTVHDP